MLARVFRFSSITLLIVLGLGCSSLVKPDLRRLGDQVGVDAGNDAGADAGVADAATVDMSSGDDAGLSCDGVACDDQNPCTLDRCNPQGVCVHDMVDSDSDGYFAMSVLVNGNAVGCGGTDCDDTNPAVHPNVTPSCDGVDNNCDGMIDTNCTMSPDHCGDVQALRFFGDSVDVAGTFSGLSDDYTTSCSSSMAGVDAIFALDIPADHDVEIDTENSPSNVDTVLAVSTSCSTSMDNFSLGCHDDLQPGQTRWARMWLHHLADGAMTRVYILVDSFDADGSNWDTFSLHIALTPTAPDMCGAGVLEIPGGGTLVGRTQADANTNTGMCERRMMNHAEEGIGRFHASDNQDVRITASSDGFVPDVYVRQGACGSHNEVDCHRGQGNTAESNITTMSDDYFFFVDGAMTPSFYAAEFCFDCTNGG